jgi:hypothetical protein
VLAKINRYWLHQRVINSQFLMRSSPNKIERIFLLRKIHAHTT